MQDTSDREQTIADFGTTLDLRRVPQYTAAVMFVACDFDGTVTNRDCLNLLVERFAPSAWREIEPRLRRRELGLVEAIIEEFRHVRVSREEALEFVLSETTLRPGFGDFASWCRKEGHGLAIVSAGFRVLIDPILRRFGLEWLPVYSGDAAFTLSGTTVWYPPTARVCADQCGMCKLDAIAEARRKAGVEPRPFVVIGDGMSDLCPAREADLVFARASLAALLERQGRTFRPFEDFYEVRRVLEQWLTEHE